MSTSLVYAIGDIHGRIDLLDRMIARISVDAELRAPKDQPLLVFLGDYVDRGPDSRAVMDRLMMGIEGFNTICLRGNHEALMLACTMTDACEEHWEVWLINGGTQTCTSLAEDIDPLTMTPEGLRAALGPERLDWLNALPLYHEIDGYMFVHAGIAPGVAMTSQKEKDLLWIRERFLSSDEDHGFCVVHGHTPVDAPDVRSNRINIDTGAVYGGALSAVVLDGASTPEFLSVEGAA